MTRVLLLRLAALLLAVSTFSFSSIHGLAERPYSQGPLDLQPVAYLPFVSQSIDTLPALTLAGQFGGGQSIGLDVQGNYAYAGVGKRLVILNVAQPAQPSVMGQTSLLPSYVYDVAVSGQYAYVADWYGGLQVVDVHDPAHPALVAGLPALRKAWSVAVAGGYAYLSTDAGQLHVVNVANPSSPQAVGSLQLTGGYAVDIRVAGGYAYVAVQSGGLAVVDVSQPAAPRKVAEVTTGSAWATAVALAGNYAYLASSDGYLRAIDISTPAHPIALGSCATGLWPVHVEIANGYAYVAAAEKVYTISLADPAAPAPAGETVTPGWATTVRLAGSHAYIADRWRGLRIYSVAPNGLLQALSAYDAPGEVKDVFLANGRLYLADTGGAGDLFGWDTVRSLDVANPAAPNTIAIAERDGYSTGGAGLAVAGNTAYAFRDNLGLYLADATTLAPTARIESSPLNHANAVAAAGSYAYVATGSGLAIVDAGNPAEPVATVLSGPGVVDVAAGQGYLYAAEWGAVTVYDLAAPGAPSAIGTYPIQGLVQAIAVSGGRAYVAADKTLFVLDVSQPASPHLLGSYTLPYAGLAYIYSVADDGDAAFIFGQNRDGSESLIALDVSAAGQIVEKARYPFPNNWGWPRGHIRAAGGYVYVPAGDLGLMVFRYTPGW